MTKSTPIDETTIVYLPWATGGTVALSTTVSHVLAECARIKKVCEFITAASNRVEVKAALKGTHPGVPVTIHMSSLKESKHTGVYLLEGTEPVLICTLKPADLPTLKRLYKALKVYAVVIHRMPSEREQAAKLASPDSSDLYTAMAGCNRRTRKGKQKYAALRERINIDSERHREKLERFERRQAYMRQYELLYMRMKRTQWDKWSKEWIAAKKGEATSGTSAE